MYKLCIVPKRLTFRVLTYKILGDETYRVIWSPAYFFNIQKVILDENKILNYLNDKYGVGEYVIIKNLKSYNYDIQQVYKKYDIQSVSVDKDLYI